MLQGLKTSVRANQTRKGSRKKRNKPKGVWHSEPSKVSGFWINPTCFLFFCCSSICCAPLFKRRRNSRAFRTYIMADAERVPSINWRWTVGDGWKFLHIYIYMKKVLNLFKLNWKWLTKLLEVLFILFFLNQKILQDVIRLQYLASFVLNTWPPMILLVSRLCSTRRADVPTFPGSGARRSIPRSQIKAALKAKKHQPF